MNPVAMMTGIHQRASAVAVAHALDGKAMAATIRRELAAEVSRISAGRARRPHLATILVGEQRESRLHVRRKHLAAEECGITGTQLELPASTAQSDLEEQVAAIGRDPNVDGILLQLPLPSGLNPKPVQALINPAKDVDGLHPLSCGHLVTASPHAPGSCWFEPCTSLAVLTMLKMGGIDVAGRHAVVLGRSALVGQPVSQLLLQHNATVSICHSKTVNAEMLCRTADILVAACGQPELVKGSWIKPGATVIDVGTNFIADSSRKSGFRLVGDVCYAEARHVAGCISPVPGGVGPMTVAMLLQNTVKSYKHTHGIHL